MTEGKEAYQGRMSVALDELRRRGDPVRRREFLSCIAAVVWPIAISAQEANH
jgi:hypothetical protein